MHLYGRIIAPVVTAALLGAGAPALAQESPSHPAAASRPTTPQNNDALVRMIYSLGLTTGQEAGALLAQQQARIAELERLCGEPCKPKAPDAAK